jgi:hypothetical protein
MNLAPLYINNCEFNDLARLTATDGVLSQCEAMRRRGHSQAQDDQDNGQDDEETTRIGNNPTGKIKHLVFHF